MTPPDRFRPFRPTTPPLTRGAVVRLRPGSDVVLVDRLAVIWDEVVHRIIEDTLRPDQDDDGLHLNIKAEMIEEVARLSLWLGKQVVLRRLGARALTEIDPDRERSECLGPEGDATIQNTAGIIHEHIWTRRMNERWKPKSAKALEREENPKVTKLVVKAVDKNHFIPKSFIRDHWAEDGDIRRWRRTKTGWTSKRIPFGAWGHRLNLYSDRSEAYFGLIEGDAAEPLKKLLRTSPLNHPQQLAFVGFLIIQYLRSPFVVQALGDQAETMAAELGHIDPDIRKNAYDTLFSNNELYDRLARPVLWSQWALVKSQTPSFVLPDSFSVRGDLGAGLRLIVPLTPWVCFVTLPPSEAKKRVIPISIKADAAVARDIAGLLVGSAVGEFIAHSDFDLDARGNATFAEVLDRLTVAAGEADQKDRATAPGDECR